jgi:aromatic ring-opening dioxygenase LigB subunit
MLNTNVKSTNSIVMNQAVSGVLQKTHKHSIFKHCHNRSNLADNIFDSGTLTGKYGAQQFVILQVMLMNENWLMIEMVKEELYLEGETP